MNQPCFSDKTKSMKPIQTALKFLAVLVLAVLAAGCASNDLLDKENAAVGAGFKVITPSKPDQIALLRKLPAGKVTQITFGGKPYYILPDLKNHQAYVGGPKQFHAYQRLRQTQQMNAENYSPPSEPVQVTEVNAVNWGEWDGWGAVGGMDGMGWPGWY